MEHVKCSRLLVTDNQYDQLFRTKNSPTGPSIVTKIRPVLKNQALYQQYRLRRTEWDCFDVRNMAKTSDRYFTGTYLPGVQVIKNQHFVVTLGRSFLNRIKWYSYNYG